MPLALENLSLNQINFIGQTMAKSGMSPDVTDGAKAMTRTPTVQRAVVVNPFRIRWLSA
jgi:hypothetical protein